MLRPQLKQVALSAYQCLFGCQPELCHVQESFYGSVVFLASPKGKVVVKFSKEVGRLAKEVRALSRLTDVMGCRIPAVLFFGRESGHDYLVFEWLDGVPAHTLPDDPKLVEVFREHYTDLLLELHEHGEQQGFELAENQYDPCLIRAFETWMLPVYRYVLSDGSPYSARLKAQFSRIWARRTEVLAPINTQSSLTHNDCHVGNVLFQPDTGRVAVLLDPLDCGYKHREFDVSQLDDVRPDLKLIERYHQKMKPADGFACRRWFLSVWQDAKHSQNIGWYDEAWLRHKVELFERAYASA
ncbi:phosphotransferase [Photobacterium atrarenae]|uniref:Phosphotransferase n=1 Tax=Photobacterium atrarenae TaxID=865757 RepID=A0ABY5GLM0_9GAMM|nr:phosphotransferase [Photobacterium atrarenae]UTV30218.1 phosphotransferase [Photobacterium atrarenae]